MDYLSLLYYPALAVLLCFGAKRCKKGEWNDACMSLEQTKAVLGFCSIGIIFHHLSQMTCVPWIKKEAIVHGLDGFANIGYLFVALFFFCSGYGLFKSHKKKADYFDHFFVKKAFPILLTAFFSSMLFMVARWSREAEYYFAPIFSVGGPSLINTYGWYVMMILALYFLFYLGFSGGKSDRAGILTVSIGIFIIILFCDYFMYGTWWYNTIHLFLAGILYSKYEDRCTAFFKKYYARILAGILPLTVITFLIGNEIVPLYSFMAYPPGRWVQFFCQMISSLLFVFWAVMLGMKIVLGNAALKFLGKMTLETYLVHGMFVQLFGYTFLYDDVKPLFYIRSVFLYALVVLALSLPLAYVLKLLCVKICEVNRRFFMARYDAIKHRSRITVPIVLALILVYVIFCVATYSSRTQAKEEILAEYAKEHINYADVGGLKMAAYDVGEGNHTIVMLGDIGDPMCTVTLRPIADGLAENGNRVILLDYFGRLFSDRTDIPQNAKTCADEIHEALGSLGVKGPVILWAHTTGGIYATAFIDAYPDEVEALVGADYFVGDAIYEMGRSFHSYDEMTRYLTKDAGQEAINLKIKDVLRLTGTEVTAYLELMYPKHTKDEKAAFEAAYGRYYNHAAIAEDYAYFVDDMRSSAGKKLPENLPSLDMLSHEATYEDMICEHWNQLHENRISNPAIQTMVTSAYDSNFVYYNFAYPVARTQEFIDTLDGNP